MTITEAARAREQAYALYNDAQRVRREAWNRYCDAKNEDYRLERLYYAAVEVERVARFSGSKSAPMPDVPQERA
jgi:hypothetical protein